ncbi:SDR family NAD(P)-dependent oxidoreductase [Roseibium denhamense]|uniref:Short-chain dehydrogenase n=1 Tax=Roseibium denhamense TaxID=76305 RepID=A0ABY1NQ66_9HYPH|nr:SDR family NAD(P)-dependent oxidoreductase [Roseibium denhamense]MTI07979.1 SDR family NAD(P)-dependent oxidoreductase [Roseibium denhamense]SMP15347.1 Short-chain dehydrogenase [Roseibium denhamense]
MPSNQYVASLSDGCAWVTGASSGIGCELALDLARDGWTVAVTARSKEPLTELEEKAVSLKGRIVPYPGDVSETETMAAHAASIRSELGPIALLIANAGIYLPQDGLDSDIEAYRRSFDVNLLGTVNVLFPALESMKDAGQGQIAIVSSVAGYRGLPTSAAYGATKAGLINMAEALKFDLDRAGIRIQVINPGFVDTPATKSNPFPMPHLISPAEAVRQIRKGLADPKRFEIAFPAAFVRQLKFLQHLPYRAYFAIVRRTTGWDKK